MKCQVEVTNYCNFNCPGCFRNTMKRPLGMISREVFNGALKLCSELDVQEIWLHNWGEPLLHPNIIELVRTTNNFKVGFTTNGSYLNKYNMAVLADAGLSYLDISVNKHTPKQLLPSIFEMYEFGNELGIETSLRSVVFSSEEFHEIQGIIGDRRVKWQRGMINNKTVNRTVDCHMIDKIFIINWDGIVVPCCQAADNEIIYTHIFGLNAAKYVREGIQGIHESLPSYCKTCKEIECEMPIIYKLMEKNG